MALEPALARPTVNLNEIRERSGRGIGKVEGRGSLVESHHIIVHALLWLVSFVV